MSFNSVFRTRYGLLGIHTLSNRKYLITYSTMQGLCLDNNEPEKTRNTYF